MCIKITITPHQFLSLRLGSDWQTHAGVITLHLRTQSLKLMSDDKTIHLDYDHQKRYSYRTMTVVSGRTTGPHMEGWTFSITAIRCQSITKIQCQKCNFSRSGAFQVYKTFFKVSKWFSLQPFICQVSAAARVLFSLKCLMQDISLFGEKDVHSMGHCPVHPSTLRLLMSYIYIYMEHLFLMFLDHTRRRSTVGRTPLDE